MQSPVNVHYTHFILSCMTYTVIPIIISTLGTKKQGQKCVRPGIPDHICLDSLEHSSTLLTSHVETIFFFKLYATKIYMLQVFLYKRQMSQYVGQVAGVKGSVFPGALLLNRGSWHHCLQPAVIRESSPPRIIKSPSPLHSPPVLFGGGIALVCVQT